MLSAEACKLYIALNSFPLFRLESLTYRKHPRQNADGKFFIFSCPPEIVFVLVQLLAYANANMANFSMLALGLKKFRRRCCSGFPPVVVSTFFNLYFDKLRRRSLRHPRLHLKLRATFVTRRSIIVDTSTFKFERRQHRKIVRSLVGEFIRI